MDGRVIFDGCPIDGAWIVLDDVQKRKLAVTVIGRAIDDLVRDGIRSDAWESSMLASAIGAFGVRFFTLAINNVGLALTPVEQRSPAAQLEMFSLADLDAAMKSTMATTR